jgi:hypothetical protein
LLVTGGVPGFTCLGRGAAEGERGVNFAGQGHLKGVWEDWVWEDMVVRQGSCGFDPITWLKSDKDVTNDHFSNYCFKQTFWVKRKPKVDVML